MSQEHSAEWYRGAIWQWGEGKKLAELDDLLAAAEAREAGKVEPDCVECAHPSDGLDDADGCGPLCKGCHAGRMAPTAAEVIAGAKKALEMAHEILRKQGIDPGCYSPRNFDEQQVLHIAEHHGYGNLMVLLSSKWYQLQRGGAFSVGQCISSNASDAREINAAIKALAAWEAAQR